MDFISIMQATDEFKKPSQLSILLMIVHSQSTEP